MTEEIKMMDLGEVHTVIAQPPRHTLGILLKEIARGTKPRFWPDVPDDLAKAMGSAPKEVARAGGEASERVPVALVQGLIDRGIFTLREPGDSFSAKQVQPLMEKYGITKPPPK